MNGKWEVKERDRKVRYVNNNYNKIKKSVSYVSTVTPHVCNESLVKIFGTELPDANRNTYKASPFQYLLLVTLEHPP